MSSKNYKWASLTRIAAAEEKEDGNGLKDWWKKNNSIQRQDKV